MYLNHITTERTYPFQQKLLTFIFFYKDIAIHRKMPLTHELLSGGASLLARPIEVGAHRDGLAQIPQVLLQLGVLDLKVFQLELELQRGKYML